MNAETVQEAGGTRTSIIRWSPGMWRVSEWVPSRSDPLSGWVERIWHGRGRGGSARYRVLPHGMMEIVAVRQGGFSVFPEGDQPLVVDGWTLQVGTRLGPLDVELRRPRFETLGVRIHPIFAAQILNRPLDELGPVESLNAVAGDLPSFLDEELGQAACGWAQIRTLVKWLRREVRACAPALEGAPEVMYAIHRIAGSHGAVRIGDIESDLGISKHRFLNRFRAMVGLTPKRFARVRRFRSLLRRITRDEGSLSGMAFRAGYADQPHMTNEFRQMTGTTPRAFQAALHRYRLPSFRLMDRSFEAAPLLRGSGTGTGE